MLFPFALHSVSLQTRIGLITTLVIDITIPFGTISILNAILIWAVRQRNRNLDSFGEVGVSNKSTTGRSIRDEWINRIEFNLFCTQQFRTKRIHTTYLPQCSVHFNEKHKYVIHRFSLLGSGQKKSQQEGRQLTLTLIFVCIAFLLLVSPVFLLLTIFTFVNKFASPERFANFSLLYVIFKTVSYNSL